MRANGQTFYESNLTIEGDNNKIYGSSSIVRGNSNKIYGSYARVTGNYNEICGSYSHATGDFNTLSGSESRAVGNQNRLSGPNSRAEGTNNLVETGHTIGVTNVYYGTNTNNPVGANQVDNGHPTVVRDGVTINMSSEGAAQFELDVASFVQNFFSGTNSARPVVYLEGPPVQQLGEDREIDDPDAPKCCICLGNAPICVALPCLHKKFCVQCARDLCYGQDGTEKKKVGQVKCPFCNEVADKFSRVFE